MEKQSKRIALRKKTKSIFIGLSTVIILFGILIFSHSVIYAKKILPRTHIGGVDVGGLSQEVAEKKIAEKISKIDSIQFTNQDKLWDFQIVDLGIIFDSKQSVQDAYEIGKVGGIVQNVFEQLNSLFNKRELPMKFAINESQFISLIDQNIAKEIEDQQLETQLIVKHLEPVVIPGKKGKRIDRSNLLNLVRKDLASPQPEITINIELVDSSPLVSAERAEGAKAEAKKIIESNLKLKFEGKEFDISPELLATWITGKIVEETNQEAANKSYKLIADINEKNVKKYISVISSEVDREPSNARISMESGQIKILAGAVEGVLLKQDETTAAIIKLLLSRKDGNQEKEMQLLVDKIKPDIATDEIGKLGIKELIGKAATDFSTSPENRKHNISTGANYLSGIIIKSGEEFSALKYLGNVDASQGYLPELVIQDNKLENQYGGGLCQNATTLFRAIMDAGLPITARQNHSRRVAYYEKAVSIAGLNLTFDKNFANIGSSLVGYDATVFVPQPDLKFRNDTGNAILVQEYTSGNTVYAEIYGTKDNRKPSVSKAEILDTKPLPETIYHNAPDIPKGTNKVVTKGAAGAKTKFTYTITYSDGKQVSQDFMSYYRPIPPEIQVGSQEVAAPVSTQ